MPIPTMPMPIPRPTTVEGNPPVPTMPAPSPAAPAPAPSAGPRRRAFGPGARPLQKLQQFVSLDGSSHIARCRYNGVWLTTSPPQPTADAALDNLQQFYMRETAQGKKDSVEV